MPEFKHGDHVRMLFEGVWHYGEITIIKEDMCKVMFEELNYDYYPKDDLQLMTEDDTKED